MKGMIVTVTLATVPFTVEEEGILIKAVVVEAGEDAVLVGLIAGLIATPGVDEEEAEEGETLMGVEEGEVGDITMIETSVGDKSHSLLRSLAVQVEITDIDGVVEDGVSE